MDVLVTNKRIFTKQFIEKKKTLIRKLVLIRYL